MLISRDMVLAWMVGLKRQTRRVMKPQPDEDGLAREIATGKWYDTSGREYKPPRQPGDVVYLAEALFNQDCFVAYKADSLEFADPETHKAKVWPWKVKTLSGMFMPYWAARNFAEILDVKAERIQSISDEDIRAEGFRGDVYGEEIGIAPREDPASARIYFSDYWDSLNAKRGHSWESNPWVWAHTMQPVEKPKED